MLFRSADVTFTWDDASSTLKIGRREGSYPGMEPSRTFRATIVRDGKLSEGKTVRYSGEEVSVKL